MRINAIKLLYLFLVLNLIMVSGCSTTIETKNISKGDKRISVYTSFYTMYDFTNKIGGDKIKLTNMVPVGTEPHDWEPTPRDIANLENADLFIYNGAGMEGWVDKVLGSIGKELAVLEASREVKLLENTGDDAHLKYDPHVWLNPALAKQQMEAIRNILIKLDPSNKSYYEKNFADNSARLDELDIEYKSALSKCTKKDIVVAHQAYGYLCEAYGLKQIAIEGLTANSEPSPGKMAEVIKFARENKVKVIFFEELISPKVAKAIARDVGVSTEVLNPLEGLKEDDIKAGKEYFKVMEENLEALKKALE